MLHACTVKFDVTGILKSFWFFVGTKQGLIAIYLNPAHLDVLIS